MKSMQIKILFAMNATFLVEHAAQAIYHVLLVIQLLAIEIVLMVVLVGALAQL